MFLHNGHEFIYGGNDLRWKLTGSKEHRHEDFLRFMDPIITIFSLHGRFFVVLGDGRVNEVIGFNGNKTDYERIYVSMRVWL